MFRVEYKYSACIKICTEDVRILCDPWFACKAYYGTWTHFPSVEGWEQWIGDFDKLFISHIHPDHYCKETLEILFKKYGEKEIWIADWGSAPNYLARKMQADGFGGYIKTIKEWCSESTKVNVIPNITGSASDIDSAILVSRLTTKTAVANVNDCVVNKELCGNIQQLLDADSIELELLCLGYTGAGPYPQTYYSPYFDNELLNSLANRKKQDFFERYFEYARLLPSHRRLPFAGKYALCGSLSVLNRYRGVADALEVKEIDAGAIVLEDGGEAFYDLETKSACRERRDFYEIPANLESQNSYYWKELINIEPEDSVLIRLLRSSVNRAHAKSECTDECVWSFYVVSEDLTLDQICRDASPWKLGTHLLSVNCNKNKDPYMFKDETTLIHSRLIIERKALFAVLTGLTHWNNYEVGSVFQVRREPDTYNKAMQDFLHFCCVI